MPELTPEERRRIYEEEKARLEFAQNEEEDVHIAASAPPRKSSRVPLLLLCAFLVIGASFFHFVWNVPGVGFTVFTKDSPSLSDTFVNYRSLENTPKIIVLAQHGSVVRHLQDEHLLEWKSPMEDIPRPDALEEQKKAQENKDIEDTQKFDIEREEWAGDSDYDTLKGHITNNSTRATRYWKVTAHYLDKDFNEVDSEYTNSGEPLLPGASKHFEIMHKRLDAVKQVRLQISEVNFE